MAPMSTDDRLEGDEFTDPALADHQPFSPQLLTRLEAEARLIGAQLVTTEKDAARLPPEFLGKVLTLPVRLEFDDTGALDRRLDALFA